ncbi:SUMF1/EgtB/PvdO family nonheme iron enzyme [Okeania sp. SIO1I7]|uniref:SUMF1/EgtB/PvdO family nonheme iron enzyme n=1 Tax=Okeania sp. SIO1I7 TaxID=2607772 RepID=UPI0013F7B176|nr:SUMF1/EgtB/PvdO family nonheme iron enzyme [Okeania sp. SIO1I7]
MSNLEESIVLISSASDNSRKADVIGTGFAFYREDNYTYLLTCAHVVEDVGGEENVLVNDIQAEVVATGDIRGCDLAVLQVENLNIPLLTICLFKVKEIPDNSIFEPLKKWWSNLNLQMDLNKKRVQIVGHSLYGEEKKYFFKKVDGILIEEVSLVHKSTEKVKAWRLSINQGDRLRKGYSGAPVVDLETGHVLGVATNMEKDGTEGLAISVEALKKIWPQIPLAIFRQPFTEDLGQGVILEMVSIPSGTFLMGSPENEEGRYKNESPQHQVTLQPFYMSKYPITQNQYQAITGKNPSSFKGGNRPVECVSWYDAVEFCQKLSQKTGKNYRLPSESQWEYACRAGTNTPFYFGETITSELVNCNGRYAYGNAPEGKYREQTTDVGSFPANAFGLYDMHGNVLEWCADDFHDNYESAPTDGSTWLENDEKEHYSVLRGGCWFFYADSCRSAYRDDFSWRNNHYFYIGFRVVCDAGRTG